MQPQKRYFHFAMWILTSHPMGDKVVKSPHSVAA